MDFAEQNQIDSAQVLGHWYYQAKFRILRQVISPLLTPQSRLADIGCGLGVFLTLMEKERLLASSYMVGIDPAAPPGQQSLGGTVPIVTQWPEGNYDFILTMDVLEHIEDDAAALASTWARLKPGGYLFVTVPAFNFLWSRHDVVLGHHRRYTRNRLRQLLQTVPGLEIRKLHYFYALILPIAMVVRFLRRNTTDDESDLRPVSPWLNTLLIRMLHLEAKLAAWNPLAGLTVVALCQKREIDE